MSTALIITTEVEYGRKGYEAFRRHGLFPVVVQTPDRAARLLSQFRADIIVLDLRAPGDAEVSSQLQIEASDTPVLTFAALPSADRLAQMIAAAIDRGTARPADPGQTADVSRASSSSRAVSSA